MNRSRPQTPWRQHNPGGGQLHIKNSSRDLKRAVTLFASIIMTGTFLLLASVILQEWNAAERRALDETYNLSGAFEEQVRRVIDGIRSAMSLLKPRLAEEGAAFDLTNWIAAAPEFAATAVQVAFVGPDGKLISSSLERHPAPADLSDREHIRVHLQGSRGLFIGKPVLGRVSNRMTIQVSDRVETKDGKLAGVIIFSISPDFLTTLHKSVRLGHGGFMILVGEDSVIRAAYAGFQKPGDDYSGISISSSAAFAAASAAGEAAGAYDGAGPLNGEAAFMNWRKVAGYPLAVIVGLGKSEAFAVSNRSAIMLGTMGAAVLALTFTITVILHREIARRVLREVALFEESRKTLKANDDLNHRHEQLLKTSAELTAERERLQQLNRDLARANEQAVNANQAKTSMLMNMSHEFRTPMHAILNYASMGLKKVDGAGQDKLRKYLENINTSGVRLLKMLNALLDLAKLESGKFDLRLSECDLAQVIRNSQTEIGSLFEAKQLSMNFERRAAATSGVFDQAQMMQVFVNLFSNAVKFAPPASAVTVIIEDGELGGGRPALHCSVADEGPGIPAAELESIFEKFTQSSKTGNGAGGSGLGLAICREIVHLHQGKIWACNGAAGGAVFQILLPTDLAAQETAPPLKKESEKARLAANLST